MAPGAADKTTKETQRRPRDRADRSTTRVPHPVPAATDPPRGRVIARFAQPARRLRRRSGLDDLTPRETDVLACLGRGLSNAEVAAELVITEATTKTHVSRVLTKLGLPSRVQAAIAAQDAGLVP